MTDFDKPFAIEPGKLAIIHAHLYLSKEFIAAGAAADAAASPRRAAAQFRLELVVQRLGVVVVDEPHRLAGSQAAEGGEDSSAKAALKSVLCDLECP